MFILALVLALGGCTKKEDDVKLDKPTTAPVQQTGPVVAAPAPTAGTKVLELDTPGGGAGGPAGTNFILPPGVQAQATAGDLGDGAKGFRLKVDAKGDALVCTQALPFPTSGTVKARLRVNDITPGAQNWNGFVFEMRSRDAQNGLVSPQGSRYTTLHTYREKLEWTDFDTTVSQVPGAVKSEFCFRFVESTGTAEVDRIEVIPDGATPPPATVDAAAPAPATPAPATGG